MEEFNMSKYNKTLRQVKVVEYNVYYCTKDYKIICLFKQINIKNVDFLCSTAYNKSVTSYNFTTC